jgi:hypothetical protein
MNLVQASNHLGATIQSHEPACSRVRANVIACSSAAAHQNFSNLASVPLDHCVDETSFNSKKRWGKVQPTQHLLIDCRKMSGTQRS